MHPTRRDTPVREGMRSLLVFDGAMGSLLYERGVFVTQNFEQLNVTRPEVVGKIHEDYVAPGAQTGLVPAVASPAELDLAAATFADQAAALVEGGVDLFVLETFRHLEEMRIAIEAARPEPP